MRAVVVTSNSANSGGAPSSSMSSSFLGDAPAFPPPYATAAPMDSPPELRKENQRIWKLSRYRLGDEAKSGMDEASSSIVLAHSGSGLPLTRSGSRSPAGVGVAAVICTTSLARLGCERHHAAH